MIVDKINFSNQLHNSVLENCEARFDFRIIQVLIGDKFIIVILFSGNNQE
jgi:hypothetical protein